MVHFLLHSYFGGITLGAVAGFAFRGLISRIMSKVRTVAIADAQAAAKKL